MGLLVNGQWQDKWYDTKSSNGEFIRQDSQFRHTIGGGSSYPVEAGRYHLFVSLACPWAHRTLIFRKLKKLENVISVSVVKAEMLSQGWELLNDEKALQALNEQGENYETSPVSDLHYLHEIYTTMDASYNGRVTVPVLWDKKTNTIVNNESSEIIRILNSQFNELTDVKTDYYPEHLQASIDDINHRIYHDINNGVYKVGFATTQQAYEKNFVTLFKALDDVENILSTQAYIAGNELTEADWRLFTTLIRFDSVYVGHFKCNLRQIENYENISNYLRALYQVPGIAETVDFHHIKKHYYYSHDSINPTRVVPLGPDIDYLKPHNRS